MSIKILSGKEVELLSQNKYVKTVSSKGITYSDEFKRIFIAEYEKGKVPSQIFKEYGFDIEVIGKDRIRSSSNRWRKAYREGGVVSLKDTRKGNSGRSTERELSIEEKYKRLEAENNLLKAENELLKKLEMMERGMK